MEREPLQPDLVWPNHEKLQLGFPTKPRVIANGRSLQALLISGEDERHSLDLRQITISLIENHVPVGNITQLNFFTRPERPYAQLTQAIKEVSQRIDQRDNFLFVFTGHGDILYRRHFLSLSGTYNLSAYSLMQELAAFKNYSSVAYFAQCFSGEFAYRLAENGFIGISNTARYQKSTGEAGVGAYFTYYLFPNLIKPDFTVESAFDSAVQTKRPPDGGSLREQPILVWSLTHPGYVTLNTHRPSGR